MGSRRRHWSRDLPSVPAQGPAPLSNWRGLILSAPSDESVRQFVSSGASSSSTNVLVVEDEMVLRMRAVDIVEDAGFTAVKPSTPTKRSILDRARTSAALFRHQMPGSMDGLKLAHAVQPLAVHQIIGVGQVKLSDKGQPIAASLASRWR
jgi:CheY-like chemotaxis protein